MDPHEQLRFLAVEHVATDVHLTPHPSVDPVAGPRVQRGWTSVLTKWPYPGVPSLLKYDGSIKNMIASR